MPIRCTTEKKTGVTHEAIEYNLPAYQIVMRTFFNLESSVPWDDNSTDTIEQRISKLKAKVILEGDDNYKLPQDGEPCEAQLNFRTARLGLAMVYQRWLEKTDRLLNL